MIGTRMLLFMMKTGHEILCLLTLFLYFLSSQVRGFRPCDINSIYQLGDSITDTGNLIRLINQSNPASIASRFPYGITLGKPTGRFSDGLLIVDYFAKALRLPLINPYFAKNVSFTNGVVFSTAGSTALNVEFLTTRNVTPIVMPDISLDIQLGWFKAYLSATCRSTRGCAEKLRMSVVFVGEIGGNDFVDSFIEGKSIQEAVTYVPYVIGETIRATREVLQLGATKVVVFGDFPFGCQPILLTSLQTSDPRAYDDKGCLIALNNFQNYRNNYLRRALLKLRLEFPKSIIIYGDYYNAYQNVLRHASWLGFDPDSALKACCGEGGAYNYNLARMCGTPGVSVCPNPSQHISWDGIHLTQQAHRYITDYLIAEIFPQLSRI